MSANNYRMDYPVADGRIVCQGHADACAEFGHATWTIDGVDQGVCPRCNEVTAAPVAEKGPEAIEVGTVVLITAAPFFLRRGVVDDVQHDRDDRTESLYFVALPGERIQTFALADLIALPEETKRRYFARRQARLLGVLLDAVHDEEDAALAKAEDVAIAARKRREFDVAIAVLDDEDAAAEAKKRADRDAELGFARLREKKRRGLARIDAKLLALGACRGELAAEASRLRPVSSPLGRAWTAILQAERELVAERARLLDQN